MPTLVVTFTPASPAPANGYRVRYRKKGSSDPYEVVSTFSSPVNIVSGILANTNYEGYVDADCGGGRFSEGTFWETNQAAECMYATAALYITSELVSEGFEGDTFVWYYEPQVSIPFPLSESVTISGQVRRLENGSTTSFSITIPAGSTDATTGIHTKSFSPITDSDFEVTITGVDTDKVHRSSDGALFCLACTTGGTCAPNNMPNTLVTINDFCFGAECGTCAGKGAWIANINIYHNGTNQLVWTWNNPMTTPCQYMPIAVLDTFTQYRVEWTARASAGTSKPLVSTLFSAPGHTEETVSPTGEYVTTNSRLFTTESSNDAFNYITLGVRSGGAICSCGSNPSQCCTMRIFNPTAKRITATFVNCDGTNGSQDIYPNSTIRVCIRENSLIANGATYEVEGSCSTAQIITGTIGVAKYDSYGVYTMRAVLVLDTPSPFAFSFQWGFDATRLSGNTAYPNYSVGYPSPQKYTYYDWGGTGQVVNVANGNTTVLSEFQAMLPDQYFTPEDIVVFAAQLPPGYTLKLRASSGGVPVIQR